LGKGAAVKEIDAATFLRDVSKHQMFVKLDQGIYRHVRFLQEPPNSWNMWFEIVTWPGSLQINGDMGSWAFARIDDMFSFFRQPELRINESYWQEKITAESRFGGPSRKFHPEQFKANVLHSLDGYGLSPPEKRRIVSALKDEVFSGEENELFLRRAIADFKFEDFEFSDSWEIDGQAYTYHFLWCLHAIVWGIQQYDSTKVSTERPDEGQSQPESVVANK
jgi:hypothetical protein